MAHTISVTDEIYDKLVEKARKLGLPIGRVVGVDEEEKKEKQTQEGDEKKETVFWEDLEDFISEVEARLEEIEGKLENIKFCPNCGSQLFLYNTHTHRSSGSLESGEVEIWPWSKDTGWLKKPHIDVSVYRDEEFFELRCPVCGYTASVVMPKTWHYKDKRKEIDLRNKEGKGESEEGEEANAGED